MLAPVEFRMRQKMRCLSAHRLADGMAIASACLFTFLAAYRIQLPGLYYDEVAFVNAAQGAPDNTFIYMKLGSVPVLIFPYMGVTLNYPLAGYSSRGANTVDILSRHARQRWTRLGRYRGLDNGG
jgi:hypothetical protein